MEEKLEGFYSTDTLLYLFLQGDITLVDLVKMNSEEQSAAYSSFCEEKGVLEDEDSAAWFLKVMDREIRDPFFKKDKQKHNHK